MGLRGRTPAGWQNLERHGYGCLVVQPTLADRPSVRRSTQITAFGDRLVVTRESGQFEVF
jgi:hypothetical protein